MPHLSTGSEFSPVLDRAMIRLFRCDCLRLACSYHYNLARFLGGCVGGGKMRSRGCAFPRPEPRRWGGGALPVPGCSNLSSVSGFPTTGFSSFAPRGCVPTQLPLLLYNCLLEGSGRFPASESGHPKRLPSSHSSKGMMYILWHTAAHTERNNSEPDSPR